MAITCFAKNVWQKFDSLTIILKVKSKYFKTRTQFIYICIPKDIMFLLSTVPVFIILWLCKPILKLT